MLIALAQHLRGVMSLGLGRPMCTSCTCADTDISVGYSSDTRLRAVQGLEQRGVEGALLQARLALVRGECCNDQ
jgi:hypothetical protein